MEENESDDNPSAFPLFNFAALKQSFTNVPSDTTPVQHTIQPSNFFFKSPMKPEETTVKQKQPRTKSKKKKSQEGESSKRTLKDILEDLQTGVPMEADVKL